MAKESGTYSVVAFAHTPVGTVLAASNAIVPLLAAVPVVTVRADAQLVKAGGTVSWVFWRCNSSSSVRLEKLSGRGPLNTALG